MSGNYTKGSIGDIRNKARRRKKYAEDTEYHDMVLERSRKYRAENHDKTIESQRKSYRKYHPLPTEEELAERKERRRLKYNAYMREYYNKHKHLKYGTNQTRPKAD